MRMESYAEREKAAKAGITKWLTGIKGLIPLKRVQSTVQAAREAKGLTRMQLAALANVHITSLYLWESGKARPRQENINKLARALDCRSDDLIFSPAG